MDLTDYTPNTKTEEFLFSIAENIKSLSQQTLTKQQETLECKNTNPGNF